ncbi:hypothetical protein SAMN05421819_3267 [Bryocella elongata]|uniref:Outer membrane protein beta-barrel domain-containing protein n=1 Tax=Bryocella elongata TaxID=863522 RepID=A0A1H6AMS0_9BACT|nr:hypothetical protein [Bryocella elongata]SEG50019.1 hypothetical protein SAMN05421819_3267 [Bryocella elongata]
MKGKFLVAALAFSLSAIAAKAQVGVYFNPVVSRISNSADTGSFAFLGSGKTSNIFGGVDFGAYYDFYHLDKFDAGVDVRETVEHGNSANLSTFLVAPRITHHYERWSPYAEIAFGAGRTKSPLSTVHVTKLAVEGLVGADFRLNKHVDVRAIEIGYGTVGTISSATYDSSKSIPSAKMLNFSSGFIFHF